MTPNSRMDDIYLHLKEDGFDVYFPAQKVGECLSPYVVIRDATTSKFLDYSSTITYYDLLCYIPKDQFSQLEPFVETVKDSMKGMYPMILPTHTQSQSYYDDSVKAHMIGILYKNYRKIS